MREIKKETLNFKKYSLLVVFFVVIVIVVLMVYLAVKYS